MIKPRLTVDKIEMFLLPKHYWEFQTKLFFRKENNKKIVASQKYPVSLIPQRKLIIPINFNLSRKNESSTSRYVFQVLSKPLKSQFFQSHCQKSGPCPYQTLVIV